MLKDIFEFILFSVVLTFIWNSVRNFLSPPKKSFTQTKSTQSSDGTKKRSHGLNWDAEEAEFEEIKDDEKLKK